MATYLFCETNEFARTLSSHLSVTMRRESDNYSAYIALRDELENLVPDQKVDITEFKRQFVIMNRRMVISRRKMDSIRTMSQMIKELENHLLISPDKNGIEYFQIIVEFIMKLLPIESEGFVEKVARLTEKLKQDSDPPLSHCRNEKIKSISVRENVVPVPLPNLDEVSLDEARSKLDTAFIKYAARSGEVGSTAAVVGVESVISDFALSLSDKIGVGGEATQAAAYIMVSCVILETFQHVLNIGSGVKNLDLTCLTLNQIKKSVQRIEKKVDKLLISPLKSAIDHFNTAVNMMISKNFRMANTTLEKVIDKATDGLNNIDDEEMNIDTFRECGTALKLIIFSKLLVYSYDLNLKIFIPHYLLAASTQELISTELETLVNRCIGLRQNVKFGSLFDDKAKKKCEAQKILNTILQVVYPYIGKH